jgi:hypothetical protein
MVYEEYEYYVKKIRRNYKIYGILFGEGEGWTKQSLGSMS